MASSYIANNRDSLTIALPAATAINQNDIVEVLPNGSVMPARVADYAVASAAGQQILAPTPIGSGCFPPAYQGSAAPVLALPSGNLIVAAPVSGGAGLGLSLLSPVGVQIATVSVTTGVLVGSVQLNLLSNGNVAVTFNDLSARNSRLAIYSPALAAVQAVTTDVALPSVDTFVPTARTMPAVSTYTSVTYGNGTFVAVAGGSATTTAATSTDGITWVARTLPASAIWSSVTFGNGVFFAVSGYSVASTFGATSMDGITWTQRALPSSNWSSVTSGNGLFVAVAGGTQNVNTAASSPDGITWTVRTLPSYSYWSSVTYGNGTFVAVAGYGGATTIAASSTDGITWTQRVLPSAIWKSVTFGNGVFVAVAGDPGTTAATSADGITWVARTLPTSTYWSSVTYGNGTFVAVAGYGGATTIAATSADGITWVAKVMPTSDKWGCVTYGAGTFVAVVNSNTTNAASCAFSPIRTVACALTGGGFAEVRQIASGHLALAIYSNTGAVVLASTTIVATVANYVPQMTALSSGGVALVWWTGAGCSYAVYSAAGAQIVAPTAIGTNANLLQPQITALAGYFALTYASTSGVPTVAVYSDAGALQGTSVTAAGGAIGSIALINDGTQFWCGSVAGTTFTLQSVPVTGGAGAVSRSYAVTSLVSPTISMAIDPLTSRLIVLAAGVGAALNWWSVDLSNPAALASAAASFGAVAGAGYPNVLALSDAAFLAYADYEIGTAATNLYVAKHSACPIIGVAAATVAAGESLTVLTGPVAGLAASYTVNTLAGSVSVSFNHTSLAPFGNKGQLSVSNLTLQGIASVGAVAGSTALIASPSCPITGQIGTGVIRYFPASTTFTVPAGVTAVRVRCWGAASASYAATNRGGSGGGFAMKVVADLTPGAVITITVGAAGPSSGNAGGTSSFGAYVSATGGLVNSAGGGTGSGGTVNTTGGVGGDGTPPGGGGGGGAGSLLGNGGSGAVNGAVPGSGASGGGAAAYTSTYPNAGGSGASGVGGQAGGYMTGTTGVMPNTHAPVGSYPGVLDLIGTGGGGGVGYNSTTTSYFPGNGWNGGGGSGQGGAGGFPGGAGGYGGANAGAGGLVVVEY